jgi:hypothetical protein
MGIRKGYWSELCGRCGHYGLEGDVNTVEDRNPVLVLSIQNRKRGNVWIH